MARGWGQANRLARFLAGRRGRTAPGEAGAGGTQGSGQRLVAAAVALFHTVPIRAALVIAACAAAYENSLATLLGSAAHPKQLGLIPVAALVVAVCNCVPDPTEPDIHDRYLDYIVGIPLLLAALVVLEVFPVVLAALYWHWRLDLVSLPLFAAGAIALSFGTRALWRMRFPILVLGLTSPGPYLLLLGGPQLLAAAGLAPLRAVLAVLPLAQPGAVGQAAQFTVLHSGQELVLRVDTAGAWIDRVLAFLIVVIPVAGVARGRAGARMVWLLAGAAATLLLYNLWLLGALAVASVWGQASATEALSPAVGLVIYILSILAAIGALPRFGLRSDPLAPARAARRWAQRTRRPAVPRPGAALAVVLAAAVLAGVANQGLRRFLLIEQPMGQPLLTQQAALRPPPPGWSLRPAGRPAAAVAALGPDATWLRYQYVPGGTAALPAGAPPLTLDVFEAPSLRSLARVGVDTVRPERAASLAGARLVDLGGGVTGRSAVYRSRSTAAEWLAISWDWPVRTPGGDGYELVIISVAAASDSEMRHMAGMAAHALPSGLAGHLVDAIGGGGPPAPISTAEARALDLLAEVGRRIVLDGAGSVR